MITREIELKAHWDIRIIVVILLTLNLVEELKFDF